MWAVALTGFKPQWAGWLWPGKRPLTRLGPAQEIAGPRHPLPKGEGTLSTVAEAAFFHASTVVTPLQGLKKGRSLR